MTVNAQDETIDNDPKSTATLKDDQTFDASLNEPSGICSMYDPKADDIKVFIASLN